MWQVLTVTNSQSTNGWSASISNHRVSQHLVHAFFSRYNIIISSTQLNAESVSALKIHFACILKGWREGRNELNLAAPPVNCESVIQRKRKKKTAIPASTVLHSTTVLCARASVHPNRGCLSSSRPPKFVHKTQALPPSTLQKAPS